MHRKIVPDIVSDQNIDLLDPGTSVLEACSYMAERHIGAVLIGINDRLSGIFTERDVLTRVVAVQRDPATTKLLNVMTSTPDTVSPNDRAVDALDLMIKHGYRHLPVVDADHIVGVVSIRDLYAAVKGELEADLRQREDFMFGSSGHGLG